MQKIKILWADDEIDLLKPHIIFLSQKGYEISTVDSGYDAIESIKNENYDIVFLDENMPGITGLEALTKIKLFKPNLPVVMITKSEEEHIMESAIGNKIADYLIKPVNPVQILSACKKILDNKRLESQAAMERYKEDFRLLNDVMSYNLNAAQWAEVYKRIVFWDRELANSKDNGMMEVLNTQKNEANVNFSDFVEENYISWIKNLADEDTPLLSPFLMKEKVFPHLEDTSIDSVFFVLLDCMRFDQWKTLQPIIENYFTISEEDTYYSILPTATGYCRNAIFAGMFPSEIAQKFPQYWVDDEEEEGKNLYEADLLTHQLKFHKINEKFAYRKIVNYQHGKDLLENLKDLYHYRLNVIVYNFIDILSHSRAELNMIRELARDEAAYRSLTKSWFEHSPLLDIFKELSQKKVRIILTTDHGSIMVTKPTRIIGDKDTTTNLRYKHGRNLSYEHSRHIFTIKNPADAKLPKTNVTSTYVFAKENYFFAYPNNYNHYVNYYRDTFQHGGISMEEMIIPVITLDPK
ncbi:MAG: PglZ domain-containing protein [Bacteroidia bacterium]|nr:PglZ domain-containing protein [Bacteroidia bacterium]MDW8348463.1 bifunctional response regulator/alkaline phosphatase family protein [Bacteroidia bacterium]